MIFFCHVQGDSRVATVAHLERTLWRRREDHQEVRTREQGGTSGTGGGRGQRRVRQEGERLEDVHGAAAASPDTYHLPQLVGPVVLSHDRFARVYTHEDTCFWVHSSTRLIIFYVEGDRTQDRWQLCRRFTRKTFACGKKRIRCRSMLI